MPNVGYATVSVIPSLKGFSGRLRAGMAGPLITEGSAAGEKTGKSFASTFAKVAVAGTAAIGAIHLGKGFVEAAVESEKVSRQTEAVLKSMGQTAGLTADGIAHLAEQQSLLSGVDDEVIQSAANVLLTFGNIRNSVGKGGDVFTRATSAALDMSVALGTDLQGATIQVGKALNDPVKGITALSRAGVSFTAQQKEQIKTLAESGDALGAQKIILGELEKQFGGSAKAQATAGDRLKVVFGNLQESIGKVLLPVVEKVASFLADKLPKAMAFLGRITGPIFKQLGYGFAALGAAFKDPDVTSDGFVGVMERIGVAARGVVEFFKRNWPAIKGVLETVGQAALKVAGFIVTKLVPAVVKVGQWVVKHKPILIGLAVAIGVGLVSAFIAWATAAAAAAIATIAAAAPVIAIGVAIAALVAGIIYAYENWDIFREAVDAVARFLTKTLWPALQDIVGFIVDKVIPVIAKVIETFIDWHIKAGKAIAGIIEFFVGLAADVAGVVADVIDVLGGIVGFVAGLPGKVADVGRGMWNWITDGIVGAVNFVIGAIEDMVNFAIDGLNAIIDVADRLAGPFINFGEIPHVDLPEIGSSGNTSRDTFGGRGNPFHHATGGKVVGPEGIDKVPSWLTAGEYVIRKETVQRLGLPFMEFLNAGAFANGGWAAPGTIYEDGSIRAGLTLDELYRRIAAEENTTVEEVRLGGGGIATFESLAYRRDMERLRYGDAAPSIPSLKAAQQEMMRSTAAVQPGVTGAFANAAGVSEELTRIIEIQLTQEKHNAAFDRLEQRLAGFAPWAPAPDSSGGASGGDVILQVVQHPGENVIDAGLRALRWHQRTKMEVAAR